MQLWRAGFAVSAIALMLSAASSRAGELTFSGDGSSYSNPDLVDDPALGCDNCEPNPAPEPYDPFHDLDWSLALRGGISHDGTGDPSYELIALPSVTLKHETIRGGYDVGLSGEVSYKVDGDPRIASISATAGGTYELDTVTTLGSRANLTVSQDDANDPDYADSVASAPLVVSGDVEVKTVRDFGLFDLALRGSAGRTVHGETIYDDDTTADNDFQNITTYGVGARLGYKLTPGLTAFVDAEAEVEQYDVASPSLLVKLDNVTYAARTGLNAKFGGTFELEGSLGLGYRDFGDETLTDFSAMLYDAKAVFRPDETLSLTGSFTTTISSPGTASGATAKIAFKAAGEAAYQVNPWLRLRAEAEWGEAHYHGIDTDEYSWGFGAGADYLVNENTDLTADYSFSRTQKTPAPATDEHQVTVGIKLHR